MKLFNEFIRDVQELRPHRYGQKVKYAVDRHLNDLKRSKKNDFPYKFDEEKATKVIELVKKLRHTKGSLAKQPFNVQPYQAFTFGSIFGWVRKDNPKLRRFRKMYKATGKKSGKSEEMAALEIIFAFFTGEIGGEVYSLATKKDQAHHIFKAVRRMCTFMRQESATMRRRIKLRQYDILDLKTDSMIGRLTADSESEDGASPSCSIIDEYHAHKDSSVLKGQTMGAMEREDAFIGIITTAGFNKNFPCFALQKNICEPILRGDIINDEFFILIFDLDDDDDPHLEDNWYKSNPNLGATPKLNAFRSEYKDSFQEGATAWTSFLTKCLNKWTDSPEIWIQSELWNKCANKNLKIEDYTGYEAVLGLDLSTRRDISALYVLIPPQRDLKKFVCIPYFFCPESKIRGVKNIDEVDYRQFSKDNEIIVTTGRRGIDYAYIEKQIIELDKMLSITTVSYDPYNADTIVDNLEKYGIECLEYIQTASWMHPPTKKLELMVLDEEIEHNGNKVQNWMMGNVVIMTDTNGNMKIDKKRSINKVDGPVALVNAIGGYLTKYADGQIIDESELGVLGEEELVTADDI